MKKIFSMMMMIAAVAMMSTACESSDGSDNDDNDGDGGADDSYTLTGSTYTGTLTVTEPQSDVKFWAERSADGSTIDIMMPETTFMPGLMPATDMAFVSIPQDSEDANRYYVAEAEMVGIYDRLPLINAIVESITNLEVICWGESISISFNCAVKTDAMGDVTVPVSYLGYTESWGGEFYITTSNGEVLLESAAVTYYEGNNALVIDGFSFSDKLSTTTLPIVGVTSSVDDDTTTLTADGLSVSYTFMTMPTTGTIDDLECEIADGSATMTFSIWASMGGGSAPASEYPCRYSGSISVESGSYTTVTE